MQLPNLVGIGEEPVAAFGSRLIAEEGFVAPLGWPADPDFPAFRATDWTFGWVGSTAHIDFARPAKIPGLLPTYFDLAAASREEVLSYLLSSAALPGAFRRVRVRGQYLLDGGAVENVPLQKALEYDCDVVFVIYLRADVTLPGTVLAQIPILRRALCLAKMDIRESHRFVYEVAKKAIRRTE
jgi:hypothetical protein